jgi:hypothetical protein
MTTIDQAHALQYAMDRLHKELCENPDNTLLSKICKNGTNCLKWESKDSLRMWPHICKIDTSKPCLTDDNCFQGQTCVLNPSDETDTQKYCGFCTLSQESGHCKFADKESCVANSTIPYTCDSGICTDKDSSKIKTPYLEWRADSSKCILGNVVLKQYAENPLNRPNLTEKTKANLPPPFRYDENVGKMYVTPDYCDHYGVEYGSGTCYTSNDCNKNGRTGGICHTSMDSSIAVCSNFNCTKDSDCIAPDVCINGKCNGISSNCYTNTGDDVDQMFLGKTLFAELVKKLPCNPVVENFTNKVIEVIKKSPENILRLADSRYMKDKKLLSKDYAGKGINMYIIEWDLESGILVPTVETGYDAEEVSKVYPQLVIIKDGKKYISIDKSQIKNDKNIKRIFLSLNSSKWLMENIEFGMKNKK